MNSFEKFGKCLSLAPLSDRKEICYIPQIITWAGTVSGITQKEMIESVDKYIQAMDITFEKAGKPDVMYATHIADIIFAMGLEVELPGHGKLGDDDLYQFIETDHFQLEDGEEYDRILQMGWQAWNGMYLCGIQKPPFTSPDQLMQRFGLMGMNSGKMGMYFGQKGVAPIYYTACAPVFDTLSQVHSMEEFCFDMFDYPEKIKEVCIKSTPDVIGQAVGGCKMAHGDRAGIYAMRSSATFISGEAFGEFAWPSLKMMIEALWAEGITSVVHADGNWIPQLEYFKDLPKGCCHFEFDGDTDMRKAYEILGGWHSMRGDVPAAMLAYGTYDDVREYCEKLITDVCMKGGVALGSGCEVPKNAKLECVKAMYDSINE